MVSSDDETILEEGRASGATVDVREARLAADETPTIDVLGDYLDRHPEVEAVVLLQPTSPLRAVADVRACLEGLDRADRVVTVTPVEHPPNWTFRLTASGGLDPVLGWEAVASRRQDATPTYRLNGAVYAVRAEVVRGGGSLVAPESAVVVMPPERSIDIDGAFDLEFARLLVAQATQPEERS